MDSTLTRRFNKAWKRFLFSKANLALLDGYGWNDGGCWILAEAVRIWAGSETGMELMGLWTEPVKRGHRPILQHLFVSISSSGMCLDGDGLLSTGEMLTFKTEVESISGKPYLQPISDLAVIGTYFIERDQVASQEMAMRLKKRFGAFDKVAAFK